VGTKGTIPYIWDSLIVAAQSGSVTALALSADHTVLLVGHSSGEIFTWDLAKPAQPHSHTPTLTPEQISTSRRDGHITGTPILHVDFLGLRHGAFVSADGTGMAFVHTLSRKLIVANVSTTRILGRYPERLGSASRPVKPHKPSCVLGMSGLPLGSVKYVTDEMQLVGMLSPYKVLISSRKWLMVVGDCEYNTVSTDTITGGETETRQSRREYSFRMSSMVPLRQTRLPKPSQRIPHKAEVSIHLGPISSDPTSSGSHRRQR
jgi:hypothetical protein